MTLPMITEFYDCKFIIKQLRVYRSMMPMHPYLLMLKVTMTVDPFSSVSAEKDYIPIATL